MKYALIFVLALAPVFLMVEIANAAVRINEVAWMGTVNSASDEWVELYSDSAEDLDGWILSTADGGMNVALSGTIAAGGYFLIERTDDSTVPDVPADLVAAFGSGLSNAGEILILKNASGAEVARVDASGGWPAGNNSTKETMQRAGSAWLTAPATPKAQNTGVPIDDGGESPPSSSVGGTSAPPATSSNEPRFSADAGGDRTSVVGAAIRFDGALYDGAGAPIAGADFLWSFGDGATARGASVYHIWRFPGEYTVFLSAALGGVSITDRLTARVIANGLTISEVKPGNDGWIEIANASAYALDISGWGISNGQFTYSIPVRTEIRTDARLVVTGEVTNFGFPLSGAAYLLYPNGSFAHEFSYAGALKPDESFHFHDGAVKIGAQSPGSDRFVFRSGMQPQKIQTPPAVAVSARSDAAQETAAVSAPIKDSFPWHAVGWFAAALGIGIIGAIGYLALRFRGII
ncbi:MAG: lamin tail domain-containing protein [Candidatus Niyogibacteria bacterium]|nr:lamin tail domain-containing protein [Candidatus Niyogibacteria bacterium]